jgi:hypothetical protein
MLLIQPKELQHPHSWNTPNGSWEIVLIQPKSMTASSWHTPNGSWEIVLIQPKSMTASSWNTPNGSWEIVLIQSYKVVLHPALYRAQSAISDAPLCRTQTSLCLSLALCREMLT